MTAARVVVDVDGDVPRVVMFGEFDISSAAELRGALEAASVGHGTIIIDLTDTTYLDSTAVGALAKAGRGDRLRIRGATGAPRRVLEMSGVIDLMEDEG